MYIWLMYSGILSASLSGIHFDILLQILSMNILQVQHIKLPLDDPRTAELFFLNFGSKGWSHARLGSGHIPPHWVVRVGREIFQRQEN